MMLRTLHLYLLQRMGNFHKLRYDLARELVVAISGGVLLATFVYIFNDFLNIQVAEISANMRQAFAKVVAVAAFLLAGFLVAKSMQFLNVSETSVKNFAKSAGETPQIINQFWWLESLTVCLVFFGACWIVNLRLLHVFSVQELLIVQTAALCLTGIIYKFIPLSRRATNTAPRTETSFATDSASPLNVMVKWRLRQIFLRNPLSQLCLLLGLLQVLLAGALCFRGAPMLAIVFVCFCAGVFVSLCLAAQLQEDLAYAWAERNMGVSHDQFIKCYTRCSYILAILTAAPVAIAGLASGMGADQSLRAAAVLAVPVLMMPYLMLQIDGHRILIQAMLVVLVGLFVATAVFAHWLGVLAFIVFVSFAKENVKGRFYRV